MKLLLCLLYFGLTLASIIGQEKILEVGKIQIPPKILDELITQYHLDPDNFRNKDSSDHKVFRVNDKYLLWFFIWSQEGPYTFIVFTDTNRILSLEEYQDRIPSSLVVDKHKFVRINFKYGYPTYRDLIATYYEMREGFLLEMASVLLKINPTPISEYPDIQLFAIGSEINSHFEEGPEYWVITISLKYSIYRNTFDQWKEKGVKSMSPHQFNVQMKFVDGLFSSIESDSERLKDYLECFYRGLNNFSDKCLEIYRIDSETHPYFHISIEDPFLGFIESLSLTD